MTADLLAALRQLRRSPIHVVVSTVSLGIGMAIAVAAFSAMKALVFDDVPGIDDRSGLVRMRWGSGFAPISLEDFEAIEQAHGEAFSAFAADGNRSVPGDPSVRAGHAAGGLRLVQLLRDVGDPTGARTIAHG